MELKKSEELFLLSSGDLVSKKNLYQLIQDSKVEGSKYWSGANWIIGNTPQQGINWVGQLPNLQAVVIKTRPGSYEEDGWADETKSLYHHYLKQGMAEFHMRKRLTVF